ncbi:MAG: hypothetical protein V4615_09310 [Bacteroidota bacterium]
MKKIISVIAVALIATTMFANEATHSTADSCGNLVQWKIPPVKGKCPEITNAVMKDGNLICVVKCSYLEQQLERKDKANRRKTDKAD